MKTGNSYDVGTFKKDILRLNKAIDGVTKRAVVTVVEQRTVNRLSFDEIEAIPFALDSGGNIVISSATHNIAELAELVSQEAVVSLEALKHEVEAGIKGVLRR